MKTLLLGNVLVMGLVLAVGEAQAAMVQSMGGISPQQWTTSGRVVTAPTISGVSQPVFIGRGAGFEGQPSPAAQFAHPGHTIVHPQPAPIRSSGPRPRDPRRVGGFGHGFGFDHNRFHRRGGFQLPVYLKMDQRSADMTEVRARLSI